MSKNIFLLLLFSLIFVFPLCDEAYSAESGQQAVLPDTFVFLPREGRTKVHWVLPPCDQELVRAATYDGKPRAVSIDSNGNPWIAFDNQHLVAPLKGLRVALSEPFWSMVHLSGGAMLFATAARLGLMTLPESVESAKVDSRGYLLADFQPLANLPSGVEKLVPGANNTLYLIVHDSKTDNWSVLLLQPYKPEGNRPGHYLRAFQRLFDSPEPITGVTGDGDTTFVALGRLVLKLNGPNEEITPFNMHPHKDIIDLRFARGIGVWYATRSSVGLMSEKGCHDLLQAPAPLIEYRGNTLYVTLSKNLAMLAFENADDIARVAKTPIGIRAK